MTTVVVQAHPVPDSLNAALLERVVAGLDQAGTEHRVFRIGNGEVPNVDGLRGSHRLVLVYPTWWGGQPAMLLDWLQELVAGRPDPSGRLGTIQRLDAVTSLGSSRLVNRVQGEWGRRFLQRSVLAHCASTARFQWVPLYKVDRQTAPSIEAHLAAVEQRFATPFTSATTPQ